MSATVMPAPAEWPALAPGRETVTWRRASDARLLMAAGYALVLQVAHPTVAAGVSEHSRFRSDPWGRLLRTLDYTYTMVYGGPQAAGEMGRRIRDFHRRIRGTGPDGRPYSALEPRAYAWVHATLAEAISEGNARFAQAFTAEQHQRFWAEWCALGRLLGIREADLPADWAGFRDYFDDVVHHTLTHTTAVDDVLAALARPAPPVAAAALRRAWPLASLPLGHLLARTTLGLLPPVLRRRCGLAWSAGDELQLRALCATMRAANPLMPAWLASTGPGYLRWRAEAIARGDVASPGTLGRDTTAPGEAALTEG